MKKRKTNRRRSKGLSAGTQNRPRRRRKNGLSEVISGANLKNSAVNAALGAAGGAASTVGTKLTNTFTKGNVIANIVIGFVIGLGASAMGAPKMGIGYSGGATALALSGGMKDGNAEFAEEDVLEEGEIYQTESGEFVKMLNDGSLEYLSEEEVEALSEGEIYPDYSTMNAFQQ